MGKKHKGRRGGRGGGGGGGGSGASHGPQNIPTTEGEPSTQGGEGLEVTNVIKVEGPSSPAVEEPKLELTQDAAEQPPVTAPVEETQVQGTVKHVAETQELASKEPKVNTESAVKIAEKPIESQDEVQPMPPLPKDDAAEAMPNSSTGTNKKRKRNRGNNKNQQPIDFVPQTEESDAQKVEIENKPDGDQLKIASPEPAIVLKAEETVPQSKAEVANKIAKDKQEIKMEAPKTEDVSKPIPEVKATPDVPKTATPLPQEPKVVEAQKQQEKSMIQPQPKSQGNQKKNQKKDGHKSGPVEKHQEPKKDVAEEKPREAVTEAEPKMPDLKDCAPTKPILEVKVEPKATGQSLNEKQQQPKEKDGQKEIEKAESKVEASKALKPEEVKTEITVKDTKEKEAEVPKAENLIVVEDQKVPPQPNKELTQVPKAQEKSHQNQKSKGPKDSQKKQEVKALDIKVIENVPVLQATKNKDQPQKIAECKVEEKKEPKEDTKSAEKAPQNKDQSKKTDEVKKDTKANDSKSKDQVQKPVDQKEKLQSNAPENKTQIKAEAPQKPEVDNEKKKADLLIIESVKKEEVKKEDAISPQPLFKEEPKPEQSLPKPTEEPNMREAFLKSPPADKKQTGKNNKKNKAQTEKGQAHKKCPYEHPDPKQSEAAPKISGMVFQTGTKEEKINAAKDLLREIEEVLAGSEQGPATPILSFAAALKDNKPPKIEESSAEIPKIQEPVIIPQEPNSKGSPELESILEEISLENKPPETPPSSPISTDHLLMQSMTDSTISDLTVVVEKSLDNISNVPDEEIMKLFNIVSKEFEKTPEPREKPKPHVFQEPMEQAGAALANLIQAVEKTESRIKEVVEDTKNKQKQNKAKKSKSKTPEKVLPQGQQTKKDKKAPAEGSILRDAVMVEPGSSQEDSDKTSTTSSSPRKSPSTDSKNAQRSDSVQSVEAQQQDGAKSLLKIESPTVELQKAQSPAPTPQQSAPPAAVEKGKVVKPIQENCKKTTNAKPIVPPRPDSTKKSASPKIAPKAQQPQQQKTAPGKVFSLQVAAAPIQNNGNHNGDEENGDEEEEEEEDYIEYKFSPRKVFLPNTCHSCQGDLRGGKMFACPNCTMIYYCSEKHYQEDQPNHKDYCVSIQEVAKKRGGHVYHNAQQLSANDFRNLRVHTLNLCSVNLRRPLQPFEKEMLLFPRLCMKTDCKNWKLNELTNCPKCHLVAFCKVHSDHLLKSHSNWCGTFNLYQKLVLGKRIEPPMPDLILSTPIVLPSNMDDLFKTLYRGPVKDNCSKVVLSQLATGPLTALNAIKLCQLEEKPNSLVIHLIGAELQFEGDTLDKWEAFFMHLMPGLTELRVVFVGPELNVENLPVEILSRIRMCRSCRMACPCRMVKFDFQCRTLYHDYVKSSAFTKPDLICYFNPGLYRMTGFSGMDTWPETLDCSLKMNCPIVVTSYTEVESPLDFAQIQKFSANREKPLEVVQPPARNPFASQRPERNFISDDVAPMIFKNYYHFVVK